MYKLIIIDDELMSLELLANILSYSCTKFKLAATFNSGADALAYMERNSVDAVLSDIKMPGMDGIELARICAERFPEVKIALVSAYRDFEYARAALKHKVVDYIIKPILIDELQGVLNSIAEQLDLQRKRISDFPQNSLRKSFQQLFADLLCGVSHDINEIRECFEKYNISINPIDTYGSLINIHIKNFDAYLNNTWPHGADGLYNAISQLIPFNTCDAFPLLVRYAINNLEVMVLHKDKNDQEAIQSVMDEIRANLSDILGLECEINIMKCFNSITELSNAIPMRISEQITCDLMAVATDYMKKNYHTQISLEKIAGIVYLNPTYFCTYFKKHMGKSFTAYLNEVRIEKAKELLITTDMKKTAVAEMVGFNSQSYFHTTFKALCDGLTPHQYRISHNKGR